MSPDRQPPKEFRARLSVPRPPWREQLRDVRWKRRRDELLRRSNWTCCECGTPLTEGHMDLQIHHVVYLSCLPAWDYPDELLVVVCDWHHKERQAVEQAIYAEVGRHLATLNIADMRRQPIYAFFAEESTLDFYPAWQREYLRWARDENDRPSDAAPA